MLKNECCIVLCFVMGTSAMVGGKDIPGDAAESKRDGTPLKTTVTSCDHPEQVPPIGYINPEIPNVVLPAYQGLANFYKETGYEPAATLSGQIARWVIEDSGHIAADGRFLPEPGGKTHFHGHTMTLLALLDYALICNDRQAIEFVRKGFEFACDNGNSVLGYFPEWVEGGPCETCELADMIAIEPGGKVCPLYVDREKYQKSETQWKTAESFVPDKQISW